MSGGHVTRGTNRSYLTCSLNCWRQWTQGDPPLVYFAGADGR